MATAIRLLEAGRLVIDTVLVLVEPSLTDPIVFFPAPVEELWFDVEAGVLGSLVMVTSGVGGDIVGALDRSAERGVLDEGDLEV